jgi:hypothetical protein
MTLRPEQWLSFAHFMPYYQWYSLSNSDRQMELALGKYILSFIPIQLYKNTSTALTISTLQALSLFSW